MTDPVIPSRNPAIEGQMAGMLRLALRKTLESTDGQLPAQVISYNRTTNKALVQPLINIITTAGIPITRAQIASVPVLSLGGGGYCVTFPIKAGDLGWIEASDRDISLFIQSMQDAKPNTFRIHSFEDGRFIPDAFAKYTIASEDASNMTIQSLDGTVKIALGTDLLNIKTTNAGGNINVDAGHNITLNAGNEIELITGSGSTLTLLPDGSINLNGALGAGFLTLLADGSINLSTEVGMLSMFAMNAVPPGWVACPLVQTLVSTIGTYARLFAKIGYAWGGSGSSFGLPYCPTGYTFVTGTAGVLSHGALLAHTHTQNAGNVGNFTGSNPGGVAYVGGQTGSTGGPDNLAAGMGVQWAVKI